MNAQQQRAAAFLRVNQELARHGSIPGLGYQAYFGGMGDARPITSVVGAGIMTAGGLIAATGVGVLPGAIVSAVGALTSLIGGLFAPDVTKIQATHIVDQIESQVLKPTLASWQFLPPEKKTQSMQAAHVAVVNKALSDVTAGCSNPQLGEAGQRCISDRVRGGRWPWPEYYLDPILNDPNVIPDSAGSSVTGSIDSAVSGVSSALGGISPLWIGAALIVVAFLVSD